MLREWSPLTELFNKLPTKIKNGIFYKDIKLTCIDVLPEYLVLGTNVGSIFLLDRKTKNLSRFSCEVCLDLIKTSVLYHCKIVHYQVKDKACI